MTIEMKSGAPRKSLSVGRIVGRSFGVGAIALCVFAVPALFDQGHFVDDLTHGNAFPVASIATLTLLLMGLGGRYRNKWLVAAALASAIFLTPLYIVWHNVWRDNDLLVHGVKTEARVVRWFDLSCGKSGSCSKEVEYSFSSGPGGEPIKGIDNFFFGRESTNPEYRSAVANGTVTILYDRNNPAISALDTKNFARSASVGFALKMSFIFIAMGVAVLVAMVGLVWLHMLSESRRNSDGTS